MYLKIEIKINMVEIVALKVDQTKRNDIISISVCQDTGLPEPASLQHLHEACHQAVSRSPHDNNVLK
jgi:hypothetical protein